MIYSHKTVQMLTLKIITTEADTRPLALAENLLKKYADPYLDAMGVFVKVRQFMQLRPEEPEQGERMIEEWFQRFNGPTEWSVKTQVTKAVATRHQETCGTCALQVGGVSIADAPDMLLRDWEPVEPNRPSTLE